jgi:hypothetical protein
MDLHLVKPVDSIVLVGVLKRFLRCIAPTLPAHLFPLLVQPLPGTAP